MYYMYYICLKYILYMQYNMMDCIDGSIYFAYNISSIYKLRQIKH